MIVIRPESIKWLEHTFVVRGVYADWGQPSIPAISTIRYSAIDTCNVERLECFDGGPEDAVSVVMGDRLFVLRCGENCRDVFGSISQGMERSFGS